MSGSFESLCGDFKALDATVRMHISEQHRVNTNIAELIKRYDEKVEKLDVRIQATERKVAWYAGGIAAILVVVEFLKGYLRLGHG